MIHQARSGPLSVLGIEPFIRYYGDYATLPDFLIMLAQYLAWTNDLATVRELLPAARKAIDWLDRYGDKITLAAATSRYMELPHSQGISETKDLSFLVYAPYINI
jgi:glycogen debranching enzyme